MNAPNKIYINVHPLGVDYSIVPIPDFGGVEYIRKDALLELVKLAYGKVSMNPFDCSEAFEELIDKLNSL